jgi:hypothetical protein
MTTNFFHPSLLLRFLDPGWVKIRIRDNPQHCTEHCDTYDWQGSTQV